MIAFLAFGAVAAVFGILFIFAPRVLIFLSEASNRIFMTDDVAIRFRIWVGIALLLVSVLMVVIAMYLRGMHG